MAEKAYYVTEEGLAALQAELEDLKVNRRKEVAEKIKEALSFGDLSENSEYDEAKNEQAKVVSRIAELEELISNAQIISETEIQADVVNLGSVVQRTANMTKQRTIRLSLRRASPTLK